MNHFTSIISAVFQTLQQMYGYSQLIALGYLFFFNFFFFPKIEEKNYIVTKIVIMNGPKKYHHEIFLRAIERVTYNCTLKLHNVAS